MLAHITIVIAHSHPLFRPLLQNTFNSKPGICIAAIVADASGLQKAITRHQPDVIVADISLPGMRQLPQLAVVTQREKPARIIFLWQYCHEPLVRKMIHNVAGFIVQDASPVEYFAAVKEVMKGNAYYCPQTEKFISFLNNNGNIAASLQKLNEKYLLLLLCTLNDFSIQETAIATDLAESTVETYRKRFKKMIGSNSYAAIEYVLKSVKKQKL